MNDSITRRTLLRAGAFASAASLWNRSSLLHAQNLAVSPQPPRQRLLMDFDWKFFQGNADDPRLDLNFGYGQGDFAKSGTFDFAKESFDDSKWQPVRLPHDWALTLPFIDDPALESHGFKPLGRRYPSTSVGWYRRTFDIPAEDRGKRLAIEFDGVFRNSLVFLNGFFVGGSDSGYVPFRFDVTDLIRYGAKNALVVRVDTTMGDGWFYEGAGIYRHVWLHKTDLLHLAPFESVVRAEFHGRAASLSLSAIVQNDGPASTPDCRVHWRILDPARPNGCEGEFRRRRDLLPTIRLFFRQKFRCPTHSSGRRKLPPSTPPRSPSSPRAASTISNLFPSVSVLCTSIPIAASSSTART